MVSVVIGVANFCGAGLIVLVMLVLLVMSICGLICYLFGVVLCVMLVVMVFCGWFGWGMFGLGGLLACFVFVWGYLSVGVSFVGWLGCDVCGVLILLLLAWQWLFGCVIVVWLCFADL